MRTSFEGLVATGLMVKTDLDFDSRFKGYDFLKSKPKKEP